MTNEAKQKTLGQAIDEIIDALKSLDEPSRSVAIHAACNHLGIEQAARAPGEGQSRVESSTERDENDRPIQPRQQANDIRHFKELKQPSTALEMACVVAYYLQSVAPAEIRKPTVNAADIDQYFRQGDFPLPKRLGQLLPDAKAAGYFDSVGRGAYKLNPVGHNLVAHRLPRQGGEPPTAVQRNVSKRTVGKKAPRRKAPRKSSGRSKKR
jgi:hypothetical protein